MAISPADTTDGAATALAVLSAMITPAVLILATSSLVLATSNRLGRLLARVRSLSMQFEELMQERNALFREEKRRLTEEQLDKAAVRAKLLQKALSGLFLALAALLLTSIAIAVDAALGPAEPLIVVAPGLLGVALLLYASVLLIRETRVAFVALGHEMEYAKRLGHEALPPAAIDNEEELH